MTNVVMYCHGTKKTGLGHFSRCLNIAVALVKQGAQVHFWGRYDAFAMSQLARNQISTLESVEHLSAGTVIVCDDYHNTQTQLQKLAECGFLLVAIDDFDQYNFDFISKIVNFRCQAATQCKVTDRHLLDLAYFPFSEDLVAVRENALKNGPLADFKHILVFIGAQDRFNIANKLISALDKLVCDKHIVLVAHEPLALHCKNNLLEQSSFVSNMAAAYQTADIVISGGGLTKYEAGFCMRPNCALSQTKEQHIDSEILAQEGLCYDLGYIKETDGKVLIERLKRFLAAEYMTQFNAQQAAFSTHSTSHLARRILEVSYE